MYCNENIQRKMQRMFKQITNFKLYNKMEIFDWIKKSNRLSHFWAGFAIWLVLMLLSVGCLSCFDALIGLSNMQGVAITITCAVICDAAVLIAMCAVEYLQKEYGLSKWDWLDVLYKMHPFGREQDLVGTLRPASAERDS